MKSSGAKYKIVTEDKGLTWLVIRRDTNEVVKRCKTYRTARNWHAAFATGQPYSIAKKLQN